MKFVDVFQFFNYLLEEMSRCNCFSLQLLGGGDSRRTLDREAGVCSQVADGLLKRKNDYSIKPPR